MRISVLEHLNELPATEWNALTGNNHPFVKHEFLNALENCGCVGGKTGWRPQHLLAYMDTVKGNQLVGAVPFYLKDHSFGEYVFDWAWAEAYDRSGLAYYPKFVAAVPFTPATGPRLLVPTTPERKKIIGELIDAALEMAQHQQVSSLHWLFTDISDTQQLEERNLMRRVGCQFHWSNPGYRDFDDFLSTLTADKRKKIKRERRYVREASIVIELLAGDAIRTEHWDVFYSFYRSTIRAHGAIAYLTRDFFHTLGQTMPNSVVLICARHHGEYVASALFFRGAETLYGRYWGGRPDFHSLHFETCYYSAIDYCIAEGLKRFEAGAQGEHKLTRGFIPTPTYSTHWLSHPEFNRAVADYIEREQRSVSFYMDELNEHSPFKKPVVSNE